MASSTAGHPYYPPGVAIGGYRANEWAASTLAGGFAAASGAVLAATWLATSPALARADRAAAAWFVLCGCIHCVFEGYLVRNRAAVPAAQHPLAQLWKEYALADSRYLVADPFVLAIETITAVVWGPLCFVIVALTAAAHPLRHPLQIVVSVAHVYGLALYFATSAVDLRLRGVSHSRPEFIYFWVYYVGLNALWLLFPVLILTRSLSTIARAFRALDKVDRALERSSAALAAVNKEAPNGNSRASEVSASEVT